MTKHRMKLMLRATQLLLNLKTTVSVLYGAHAAAAFSASTLAEF